MDSKKNNQIEWIDAKQLLVPNRIDLVAKYLWIKAKDQKLEIPFFDQLYKEAIWCHTSGKYVEEGQEDDKNTYEAFCKTFIELKESIDENGIDPSISVIPVGRNNSIMNGAHRTAIALYKGIKVPIVRDDSQYPENGAEFFEKNGMREESLDYLVLEYLKLKRGVFALIIWPLADDVSTREKAEQMIRMDTTFIYRKEVLLNQNGLRNLILQIYQFQDWIGTSKNHYLGATKKAKNDYKDGISTIVYFVEGISLKKLLELKEKIRNLFGLNKEAIHSTDNDNETLIAAESLLNDNSVHLLNRGMPDCYDSLNKLHKKFKMFLLEENEDKENYIIDSSFVLGLYGLREPGDLDYLTISKHKLQKKSENIDEHSSYVQFHKKSIEDLVLNPKNYLYYNELKYITLDECKRFKINRREKKDLEDINLIGINRKNLLHIIKRSFYLIKRRGSFCLRSFYGNVVKEIQKNKWLYVFLKKMKNRVWRK